MNVAETIAAYLDAAEAGPVFGYPGDPSVPFLEACRDRGLDFVLARREGTAGLMASAWGMLTGRPGVALSTLGPGSTNLVNAVASAWLDRSPMIAISGQIETGRYPAFTHQVVDQEALFGPVSKWAVTVAPHTAGQIMRKAHRIAVAPRPGPVHISTPGDVIGADCTDDAVLLPPVAPERVAVEVKAPERLTEARRPVLLVGIGALDAGPEAVRLAERIGAAVVAAPMAKGVVPEDHPLFAGTLDMACNGVMWGLMDEADVIVAAGFDAVELIKPWRVEAPVIHVDAVPNVDQIYAAETEFVGPVPTLLAALADACPERDGWGARAVAEHRERLAAAFEAGRVTGALNPSDVVRVAAEAVPNPIATTDVGSHKLLVGQGWRPSGPRRLLMSNGLSSMGFSLPAAIAAGLHSPGTPILCFTGDGGLAMVQSELRLAASRGLPLKVVVFVDGSLNRIELKQMVRQLPSTGTRIEETDTVKLAESMGCLGVEVSGERGLADALMAEHDVPLLIGARIDPAQYEAQFR